MVPLDPKNLTLRIYHDERVEQRTIATFGVPFIYADGDIGVSLSSRLLDQAARLVYGPVEVQKDRRCLNRSDCKILLSGHIAPLARVRIMSAPHFAPQPKWLGSLIVMPLGARKPSRLSPMLTKTLLIYPLRGCVGVRRRTSHASPALNSPYAAESRKRFGRSVTGCRCR